MKLGTGVELTEEEKQFLTNYDPEKSQNEVAAAARRKAEAELNKLKNEYETLINEKNTYEETIKNKETEKLTETQKLAKQMEILNIQINELKKAKEEAELNNKKIVKKQTIQQIRQKNNINWINGIDPSIAEEAFEKQFNEIEDFEDEASILPIIENFKNKNKGLISSGEGYGTGNKIEPKEIKKKKQAEMSIEEREKELKEKGLIR